MAVRRSTTSGGWFTMMALLAVIVMPIRALSAPQAADEKQYRRLDPELFSVARQYFKNEQAGLPPKRVFRLTRDQIDATVKSLLPQYFVRSVKEAMPRDPLQTNYEYAELLNLNDSNGGGLADWISEIAARVEKNPTGVINCSGAKPARECLRSSARQFVTKAFRGDVESVKLDRILELYSASVDAAGINKATAELVGLVLNSPAFLFRRETIADNANFLSPVQRLQALSYTIVDAPPEAMGYESPRAAEYMSQTAAQTALIEKLTKSAEAREKLLRFLIAWLEVKESSDFEISPQKFPKFSEKLAESMRAEVVQFLRAELSKAAPKLKDITTATRWPVPSALRDVYASTPAQASGKELVKLDPAQRLGIFSQPAVIASHSGPIDSRPIKRGVFWVRKVMCMDLEPPPKDLHPKLYELTGATERQRIEQSTSGPNCVGCHKVINPFAFFQESYDALGRWRTEDKGQPIDTSTMIDFLDEEPVKTTTAVEALKTLTSSLMFKQCFVRQMFRFYTGRNEEPSDDPLLRRMFFEFAYKDEQDILGALRVLVTSDRMMMRQ